MVRDNYVERFKKRNNQQEDVDWISNSINKVQIKKGQINHLGNLSVEGNACDAVHIFQDKEGPNNAILYTYREDGFKLGDLIVKQSFKNGEELVGNRETYFLFEESPRVDGSENTRVFTTIEANAIVKAKAGTFFPAYFKGEMRTELKISYSAKSNVSTLDNLALLIVPRSQFQVHNKDTFEEIKNFKGAYGSNFSWEVEDKDEITTQGMQYVSIKKTLKVPNETTPEEEEGENKLPILAAGSVARVPTNQAHFAATPPVKVTKRTATEITFDVPGEPGEIVIETKGENGEIITTPYLIVI